MRQKVKGSWYERNKAKACANQKIYRDKNKTAHALRDKKRYEANKDRHKVWARNANRARRALAMAKRRATKRNATPAWAKQEAMLALYVEAVRLTTETGIVYHVDHIVPLQSKLVCGLHWEGNMRVLAKADNLKKHNSTWPDCPQGI